MQLAVALLADAEDPGAGRHLGRRFMQDVIADLDDEWELAREEIVDWIRDRAG